jgi:hypothetical protein
MPRFQNVGAPNPALIPAGFFVQANHRFSTHDGSRPTTLYFQDMFGNRGRYRRGHAQGEQLIYQGRCRRLFVSPTTRDDVDSITASWAQFMAELVRILGIVEAGNPNPFTGEASLHMQPDWHVFDTNGIDFHLSKGTVVTADNTTAAAWGALANYLQSWAVW